MEFFKNIFARIWALWALITFIITFIIFLIPSLFAYAFKDFKKGQAFFLKIAKIWMDIWLFLIACPVKIYGRENYSRNENYIVVFNHNAFLDVPLSAPYVGGPNKTIAKDSFAKIPLFGLYYKRGSVLINREDERSRQKSFEQMKKVLAMGINMCIYPEGTRNRSSQPLKPFYDGAFKLAEATNKKILPCIITGTKKAMPINKTFYLLPTKLEMHFMKPVPPVGSVKDLKEKVFNLMEEKYIIETSVYK